LVAKYIYEDEVDGTYGKWIVEEIRDPIIKGKKTVEIPCAYNWETKELRRIDELEK